MPRFYFHLSYRVFIPDNKGAVYTTRKDAEAYANHVAAEYGRNRKYISDDLCVCVVDEMGVTVFRSPVVNHARKVTADKIEETLRSEDSKNRA